MPFKCNVHRYTVEETQRLVAIGLPLAAAVREQSGGSQSAAAAQKKLRTAFDMSARHCNFAKAIALSRARDWYGLTALAAERYLPFVELCQLYGAPVPVMSGFVARGVEASATKRFPFFPNIAPVG